jgi:nitroreductase
MALIEDLNWRHAVKAYDPKRVSKDKIDKIEAARLAPTSSSYNLFRFWLLKIKS